MKNLTDKWIIFGSQLICPARATRRNNYSFALTKPVPQKNPEK